MSDASVTAIYDELKRVLVEQTGFCAAANQHDNAQHLLYFFMGYRDAIINDLWMGGNPYSPGSARASSWEAGSACATEHLAKRKELKKVRKKRLCKGKKKS